jgi:quercetin dioxygenase-like cupin family protein
MSLRRITLVSIGVAALLAGAIGTAVGTPSSGVSAETARGPLVDRPLAVNMSFDSATKVKLSTKGEIEVAVQRIVATPGATFGWHHHPGPTLVTVLTGTLTLYHAEDCTHGIDYGPGTSFSNLPSEVHLARNNGTTDLVVYASYFVPASTPPVPLRIDEPLPAPDCPQ